MLKIFQNSLVILTIILGFSSAYSIEMPRNGQKELNFKAPIALITGCNRGIGLALCEELASNKIRVIATCRQVSPELENLANIFYEEIQIESGIDICNLETLLNLKEKLKAQNIRNISFLILNAGQCLEDKIPFYLTEELANIRAQLEVNTLGPITVTEVFDKLLIDGSKVINIASRCGSIPLVRQLPHLSYGVEKGYDVSKAGAMMWFVCKNNEYRTKGRKISVANVHPGYVMTAINHFYGDVTPKQSAKGIYRVIEKLKLDNSGMFWNALTQDFMLD